MSIHGAYELNENECDRCHVVYMAGDGAYGEPGSIAEWVGKDVCWDCMNALGLSNCGQCGALRPSEEIEAHVDYTCNACDAQLAVLLQTKGDKP